MTTGLVNGTLRTLVAVALLLLLVTQIVVLPWASGEMARSYPEVAYARWPVLAASIIGLLCLEIMLASIWRLLGAVHDAQIFNSRSFRWVNLIVWSLSATLTLTIALFVYVVAASIGPITVSGFALLLVFTNAGILLIMVTMRSLLDQATKLQLENDSVI